MVIYFNPLSEHNVFGPVLRIKPNKFEIADSGGKRKFFPDCFPFCKILFCNAHYNSFYL